MNRILPICLACFIPLAACSAQGAAISAPTPAASPVSAGVALPVEPQPDSLPPASPLSLSLNSEVLEGTAWNGEAASLPQALVDGQAELSCLLAEPSGATLLAQLSDKDIFLYGIWDEEYPEERCLLQLGDHAWVYDLPWATPRCYLPRLCSGDFDGDGTEELALLTYVGSGTGVSYWTLALVELEGEIPTLRALSASSYEDALTPHFSCTYNDKTKQATLAFNGAQPEILNFSHFTPSLPADAQLSAAVGDWVEYTVEEDAITVCLGVNLYGGDIPPTCLYPADLIGRVSYDGARFSLTHPSMTQTSGF